MAGLHQDPDGITIFAQSSKENGVLSDQGSGIPNSIDQQEKSMVS